MSPQQALWQAVILRQFLDATCEIIPATHPDIKRWQRDADRWIRGNGRDYRLACSLAGLSSDFLRESYIKGRIDKGLLRSIEGKRATK